ncbi:type II secretion system F family protein [Ornithinimicrobium pekingense]|uniref:Pilus assembly protein TadB n=1 Tax=Ornithinimicrobium pekingense TaxID=384677 RepID=A0ABQ2F613_9MICO|nr:type II secretion system F family protein [Ornithinimicrobium pekingense]GGK64009.1 pilus assembly protein TadB [Ornithinimicrobium pekingense]
MTPVQWWGAGLGLLLAGGLLLVWAGLPLTRRSDLTARIEPYLDRAPLRSRLLLVDDGRPWRLGDVVDPLARRGAAALDQVLGGTESVRSRLQRAGLAPDVEGFRIQQVLWGLASAVLAAGLGSVLWWTRGASVVALGVLVGCAFLAGVVVRDTLLSRAAARRERLIMAEFPAVAELLALSVTAGEGTVQALERVARLSSGELAGELQLCLAQARTGASLPEALQALSRRTGLAPIVRFVDGLVVAIQRGTPLGEVLRAQAADAREAARQGLIEEGGRREITMMVPVVFLVLPVTVLFAVFPGVTMLRIAL